MTSQRAAWLLAGASLLMLPSGLLASDYYHPDLLRIDGQQAAVDRLVEVFSDNDLLPGRYEVTLLVNKKPVTLRDVDFLLRNGDSRKARLYPCLRAEDLEQLGMALPEPPTVALEARECVDLEAMAYVDYRLSWKDRALFLTVPQSYLDEGLMTRAEEKLWSDGIDNFSMNYALSSFKNAGSGSNYYANLRPGVNIGAWRYRNYSTWMRGENGLEHWNTISNTLSRDLRPIRSELILGDSYTPASLFDSVKFRGVKLQTNELMIPSRQHEYVPAIRGLVNSDAQISISQNGNVIYQNSVSAGPYEITDYYPSSYGGDLVVSILEADGSTHDFVVPYATLPIMERQGEFKYSALSGKYIGDSLMDSEQYLGQFELAYGLSDFYTLYGGVQMSRDYQALALGLGSNLGRLGAVSSDFTVAQYHDRSDDKNSGRSLGLNYAKGFTDIGTSVVLASRYSLDDSYRGFQSVVNDGLDWGRERSHLNLSVNQPLSGPLGSISLGFSRYSYYRRTGLTSYNLGYSGSYKGITYNLYLQKFQNGRRHGDPYSAQGSNNQVSLNVTIPLSWGRNPTWVSYSASHTSDGAVSQTANLGGSADQNRLSWNVHQGHGNQGVGDFGGASVGYRSGYGDVNAAYSYAGRGVESYSYGASGAVTLSEYGMLLSQQLYESNALVVARDAAGVRVQNSLNTVLDGSGLGVVSGLSAYRNNTVTLDTTSIPESVDLRNSIVTNLFPSKGALLLSRFETEVGYKLFLIIKGPEVPSGAEARLEGHDQVFNASGFNQLYLVVPASSGSVRVSWMADDVRHACSIAYDLEGLTANGGLYLLEAECLR